MAARVQRAPRQSPPAPGVQPLNRGINPPPPPGAANNGNPIASAHATNADHASSGSWSAAAVVVDPPADLAETAQITPPSTVEQRRQRRHERAVAVGDWVYVAGQWVVTVVAIAVGVVIALALALTVGIALMFGLLELVGTVGGWLR